MRPRSLTLDAIAAWVDAAQCGYLLQRFVPRVDCGCMTNCATLAAVTIVAHDRIAEAGKNAQVSLRLGIEHLVCESSHNHWGRYALADDCVRVGHHIRSHAQQQGNRAQTCTLYL